MRKLVFAALLVSGVAMPAWAYGAEANDAAASTASADEAHLNEVVCKKVPPPVGSRIGEKKVCLTNREWLAKWDAAKRDATTMQSSTIGGAGR